MELITKFKNYLAASHEQGGKASSVTVKNYSADVRHFIEWAEEYYKKPFQPSDSTIQQIQQFKAVKAGALSASSLDRHISSLRKFFTFLKLDGQIAKSPFEAQATNQQAIEDPWHLRGFKDYLYVYNASNLTIKNYIIDVKQFLHWAEEVVRPHEALQLSDKNILNRIDSSIVEEYKQRLIEQHVFSPSSINRKLSSLRKYLTWAGENGFLSQDLGTRNYDLRNVRGGATGGEESTGPRGYSKVPPIRLFQKLTKASTFAFDLLIVLPVAHLFRKVEHGKWVIGGKKVFFQDSRFKIQDLRRLGSLKLKIKNISKEFYSPLSISTADFPLYKKVLHHLRYTRPQWYRSYHRLALAHYFNWAVLIIFATAIGFGMYNNFVQKPNKSLAALPTQPIRVLSFQGRLTDANNNPITTPTNLRFVIYSDQTASGSARQWEEVDKVTPDQDGIFSLLLGSNGNADGGTAGLCNSGNPPGSPATGSCGIPSSLFANNSALWLGVAVEATAELTPREQLATVAYASNAETLQGLPPITQSGAGTNNVVLALNSSGNLSIGASTTFQSTTGQFTLSGNTVAINTNPGTNGNINLSPDGQGFIGISRPLQSISNNGDIASVPNAVTIEGLGAILATSSGQSAFTIDQNGAGPIISASTSGSPIFTVGNSGTITDANYTTAGGVLFANASGIFLQTAAGAGGQCLLSSGGGAPTWGACVSGSGSNAWTLDSATGTLYPVNSTLDVFFGGTSSASAKFAFINDAGGTPTASIAGNLTLNSAGQIQTTNNQTLTIGGNSTGNIFLTPQNGTGSVTISGLGTGVVHGNSGLLSTGNVSLTSEVTGVLPIVNGGTNTNTIGSAGSLAYSNGSAYAFSAVGTAGECLLSGGSGAPTWQSCQIAAGASNYWTLNAANGTLYPVNTTLDVFFGGTATSSANFAFINNAGGTPTASISGNLTLNSAGVIQTTQNQTLTIGGASTGNIIFGSTINSNLIPTLTDTYNLGSPTNEWNNIYVKNIISTGSIDGFWQRNFGALTPTNITDDLLLGSTATSSAKFAVLNIAGGTPVASISSGLNGNGAFLSANGVLQTTNDQSLNLGGNTTGNIFLSPQNGTGIVTINGTSLTSSASTFNLFNGVGTTLNFAQGASTINIGPASGTVDFAGGTIDDTNSTLNLFATPTTLNIGGSSQATNLKGNVTLGTSNTNTIAFNGLASTDIVPSGNGTINLGSPTHYYNTVYANSFNSPAGNGVEGFWTVTNNTNLFPTNTADDVLIGGNGTGSAAFQVFGETVPGVSAVAGTATSSGNLAFRGGSTRVDLLNNSSLGLYTSVGGNSGLSANPSLFISNNGTAGNVGIGTNTTPALLTVAGTASVSGILTVGNGVTNQIQSAYGPLQLNYKSGLNTYGQALTIQDGTGNIGIGTSVPSSFLLQVAGNVGPNLTNTYDLGSPSKEWNNLYVNNIISGGTISGFWQRNFGVIAPANITDDLAIGGTSTASATPFQVFGTAYTNDQGTVTAGTATTSGNLVFRAPSATNIGIDYLNGSNFVFQRSPGGDKGLATVLTLGNDGNTTVANNLAVNGNAITSTTSNFSLLNTGVSTLTIGGAVTTANITTAATTLHLADSAISNTLSIGGTGGGTTTVNNALTVTGTFTANGNSVLGASSAQTIAANGQFTTSLIPNTTDLYNLGSPSLEWNNLYVKNIISSGTVAGFWQRNLGVLSPANITDDLILGATATSSGAPVFGFLNVAGGTPTASVAANLSLKVPTGGSPASSLNLLNGGTLGVYTASTGQFDAGLSATPALYVANSGNIGIGTSSPIALLHVNGTASISGILTLGNGTTNQIQSAFGPLQLNYKSGLNTWGQALTVQDSTGNIGIATANPTSFKVQVAGSVGPNATNTFDLGSLALQWNNIYAHNIFQDGQPITQQWQRNLGVLSPLNISDDLAIGGASTTSAKFQVFGLTGNATTSGTLTFTGATPIIQTTSMLPLTIGSSSTGSIQLSPKGSTGLYVDGSGNVAIGTTAPTALFDVAGSASISSALTFRTGAASIQATADNFLTLGGNTTGGVVFGSNVNSNILPDLTNTYNLGSPSLQWNNIYANQIFQNGQPITQLWVENLGALAPLHTQDDLLLGGVATSDAGLKFGFLNVASGTPTATISSNLSLKVPTGSNPASSLNLLNGGTLGIYTATTGKFDAGLSANPALYVANTGNIGIGTTTTGSPLYIAAASSTSNPEIDVQTPGALVGDSNFIRFNSRAFFGYNGSTQNALIQGIGGKGIEFNVNNNTFGSGTAMVITSGGNVGIATTTPTAVLDVAGAASVSSTLTFRTGSASIQATADNFLTLGGNTTGGVVFGSNVNSGILPVLTNTYDLGSLALQWNNVYGNNFYSNGQLLSQLWVENTGALTPLHTQDDLLLGDTATKGAALKFGFLNVASGTPTATISSNLSLKVPTGGSPASSLNLLNGGTLGIYTATAGQFDAGLQGTTTPSLFVANSGNVGVGTNNPSAQLMVSGPGTAKFTGSGLANIFITPLANNGFFGTNDASALHLRTTNIDRLDILSTGQIGIGTGVPLATVDIRGISGTTAVASASGQTSFAALVANNDGVGDLFTASSSSIPMFTIKNDGTIKSGRYITDKGVLFSDSTGTFTQTAQGASNTVLHGNGSSAPTFSAVDLTADVTGTLPINKGGTNGTAVPTLAQVAYGTGTAYAFTASGSTGQCLTFNSGAAPTWANCATGAAGTNFWNLDTTNGVIYPINSTVDLLAGGSSTASAHFAVIGTASNTTIASASAQNAGGNAIYLDTVAEAIQTTKATDLTLGGTTTGAIVLSPNNSNGIVKLNSNTLNTTSSTFNLINTVATTVNFAEAANALTIGATGGTTTFQGATLDDNQATVALLATPTTLNIGGSSQATNLKGNITLGTSNTNTFTPTALMNADLVPTGNGSINLGSPTHYYNVVYANSFSSPTGNGTSGFWTVTNNTNLFPTNQADDLLIGGNASNSAAFQIFAETVGSIVGGTATTAGNLTFRGTAASQTAFTASLLNDSSLNFQTSVGGDATVNSALFISRGTRTTPGNVGIGTTTVPISLTVGGTTGEVGRFASGGGVSDQNYISVGNVRAFFGYNGTGTNAIVQGVSGTGIQFNVNNNTFGSGTAMTLTSGGNLGIGTTSPLTALHVVGSASVSANLTFYGSGTAHTVPILQNGTLSFNTSVGGDAVTNTSLYIAAGTANVAGNVGINTTNPTAQLTVAGTASVSGILTVGNGVTNQIQSAFGPLQLNYKSGLNTWGQALTVQDTTGFIGIGTTSPTAPLKIVRSSANAIYEAIRLDESAGGTSGTQITFGAGGNEMGAIAGSWNNTSALLTFYTGTGHGERMRIDQNGNFGLNTTTLNSVLQVSGGSGAPVSAASNLTTGAIIENGSGGAANNWGVNDTGSSSTSYIWMQGAYANNGSVHLPIALELNGGNVGIGTTNPNKFILQTAGDVGPNANDTYNLGSDPNAGGFEWNNLYVRQIISPNSGGVSGYWQLNSGSIAPTNITNDVLAGGVATSSATFHVWGASGFQGTSPVASIAANTSFAGLVIDNKGVGDLLTASMSGVTRFTVTGGVDPGLLSLVPGDPKVNANNGVLLASANIINVASSDHSYMTLSNRDLTIGGHKNNITLSNVGTVYIYDTTKDSDGGTWTNDERAQASSWYNESRTAADACVIGTNARCGTQAFPRKAIIVVTVVANTSGNVYIFDAKDNSLWMQFKQGSGATEQMIGPSTNSDAAGIAALNGRIYLSKSRSTGGVYVLDFIQDSAYKYTTTGYSVATLSGASALPNIANRNTTITFSLQPGSNAKLINNQRPFISANVVAGKTYFAVGGAGGANGTVQLINDSDKIVTANFGPNVSSNNVWLTSTGTVYALVGNSTAGNYALKVKYSAQNVSGNNVLFDEGYAYVDATHYGGFTQDTNTFGTGFWNGTNAGPASNSATFVPANFRNAMHVTEGTSTIDGKSDTVYIAAAGSGGSAMAFQLKKGDPNNASVKYYTNTYISEDMIASTIAMYPLDNNVGSGLTDISASSAAGTTNNLVNGVTAPTYATSGVRNLAATFVQNTYAVSSGSGLLKPINNPLTISGWVHPTTVTITNGTREMWISADKGTASKVSWGIGTKGDGGQAQIYCFANGTSFTELNSAVTAIANTWYHVAMSSDGSGNMKCYVDGQLTAIGTVTTAEIPTAFSLGHTSLGTNFQAVRGDIDEVMVTGSILTASEINHMFQVGFRSLQNHASRTIRSGITISADQSQQINGGSSNTTGVAVDTQNSKLYIGTNAGGISVIGLDNDSIEDAYNANMTTTDDTGSSWVVNNNTTNVLAVGQSYGNGAMMVFGSNNGGNGGIWLESQDTSLKDFLATSYNPFGTNLTQSNLTIDNVLRVTNQISTRLDNLALDASSSAALTDLFRVDNLGMLVSQPASSSATAIQFLDPIGNMLLNIDNRDLGNPVLTINQPGAGDIIAASASGVPEFRLTGSSNLFVRKFTDLDNTNYFIDPAASGTNPSASVAGSLTFDGGGTHNVNLLATGGVTGNLNFQRSVGGDAGLTSTLYLQGSSGLVGIGSTSPTLAGLTVDTIVGNTNAIFGTTNSSNFGISIITNNPTIGFNTYYNAAFKYESTNGADYIQGGINGGDIAFGTAPSGTINTTATMTERMRLTQAGNLGIGTTNPAALLAIANGANDTTNYGHAIQITNSNGNSQQIAFIRNGNNVVSAGYKGASAFWGFGAGNATDASFTPSYLSFDLAGSGNVGINNVNSSAAKLVVTSTGNDLTGTAASAVFRAIGSNLGTSINNEIALSSTGTNCGNQCSLGVRSYREAAGSDWTTSGMQLSFDVDNTVRAGAYIELSHSGNVGIGSTAPAQKLDVVGQANVSSFINQGGLTSAIAGVGMLEAGNINNIEHNGGNGWEIDNTTASGFYALYAGIDSTNVAAYLQAVHNTVGKIVLVLNFQGGNVQGGGGCAFFGGQAHNVFCSDYAEYYNSQTLVGPGEIVTNDETSTDSARFVMDSTEAYDNSAIGIVSTTPAVIIDDGAFIMGASTPNDHTAVAVVPSHRPPIASAGRVPVNFISLNGPVHIGDAITSSGISGFGMKATRAGPTVGKVLEDFDPANGKTGQGVIDCPAGTPNGAICGKVMVLLNISWYDPDVRITSTGVYNINQTPASPSADFTVPHYYTLADALGNPITRMGAFLELAVGNLRAGSVNAQQVLTNSLAVATDNVSVAGQSLHDYVTGIVQQVLSQTTQNSPTSPIAQIDSLHAGIITPLGDNPQIAIRLNNSGIQITNGASGSAVASIDNAGNATFSGTLNSQNLAVNGDATVSGTLHANRIEANTIAGLQEVVSTLSAQNITNVNNIYFASPSAGQNGENIATGFGNGSSSSSGLPGQTNGSWLVASGYTNIASYSAYFAYVPNLNATTGIFQEGLTSLGPTSLTDTTISGQLAINGSLILADNSINVLGDDFHIQPLRQGGVTFEGGLIAINTNGDLTVNGNAMVKGVLAVGTLSPLAGKDITIHLGGVHSATSQVAGTDSWDGGNLVATNASGSSILNINQLGDLVASGEATFSKLNLGFAQPVLAVSDTEVVATGSAGTATIKQYQKEVTIDDPRVTTNSLIYITPVGDTSGQTPYLERQVTGSSFSVGVPTYTSQPVNFNWLIVN